VPLPPKTIVIEKIQLSKQEREVYDLIQDRVKRNFNRNLEVYLPTFLQTRITDNTRRER